MSYRVLALKWRPRNFDEVVGQATLIRTLKNALASGRIGHAFLLSGARGVGKTTTARILAKALNCSATEKPTPNPCGECSSCREIADGNSLDVQEIDGATHNGVEAVRDLRESARYNPARDRFKIWIIDEVHMLSTAAFNALLKTLEEPPPRVKFIFATTEYHKIPDTILSRCQQYDFRMIPARELVAHLRKVADGEGIKVSDEALARFARAAEGSVRDALSLFDQVLAFSGSEIKDEDIGALLGLIDRELLLAASRGIAECDSLALLELVDRLSDYGADYRNFTRELLLHLREILLVKLAPEGSPLLAPLVPEDRERIRPLAAILSEEDLLRMFEVLTRTESDLRWAQDPRVTLELALLKMAQMRRLMPMAELVARVESLAAGKPLPARSSNPAPLPSRSASASLLEAPPPMAPRPAVAKPEAAPRPASTPNAPDADSTTTEGLLAAMQAQARPSMAPSIRTASARLEGDTLLLELAPEWAVFAETHQDDYRELARKAAGRPLKVKVAAGAARQERKVPSSAEDKRRRLVEEATKEPAVQEALDLFGGKVVGVREVES